MARTRTAKPQPVEPEDESQEIPETTEPEPPNGKAVSKSEAARVAIAEGYDSPADAVAFIKRRFGIDMGAQHFSAVKSQEKKKLENSTPAADTVAPTRKKAPLVEGYLAPPPKPRAPGDGDLLLALENIKELVGQYGADKVKRMVDLLG